jgi:hypothetical protein
VYIAKELSASALVGSQHCATGRVAPYFLFLTARRISSRTCNSGTELQAQSLISARSLAKTPLMHAEPQFWRRPRRGEADQAACLLPERFSGPP